VDNNYLDLGMNKRGFVNTLPSGGLKKVILTRFRLKIRNINDE
jgi:hypothetical protein